MRFFAHDGKEFHGPSAPEELLKLPGFDGDTLVCPVGSENSTDWKPALAYPPFREALLTTEPKLRPLSPPPPAAPPPPPTVPCPSCARGNPMDAVFCNGCAARMDGRVEPREPKRAMANAREPEPLFAAPESAPVEPQAEALSIEDPPAEAPAAPAPWRKILIASFAGAALAGAGLGWRLMHPASHAAAPVPDSTAPPAAAPAAVSPAPPSAAVAAASLTPSAPAVPVVPKAAPPAPPAPLAPRATAKRARRRRKPKPGPETAPVKDKALLDALESDGSPNAAAKAAASAKPAVPAAPAAAAPAAAAPAADGGFMLPGLPRRVPPKSAAKAGATPPAAKADAAAPDGAAAGSGAAEDETSRQVREQFVFCAQLLSQGAYADHFDTCLCADARQAAPYLGRRGSYASSMKKAASDGTLEVSAEITGVVLDGAVAKVTADWKSGGGTTRTETESWRLDDGLWCRSP